MLSFITSIWRTKFAISKKKNRNLIKVSEVMVLSYITSILRTKPAINKI